MNRSARWPSCWRASVTGSERAGPILRRGGAGSTACCPVRCLACCAGATAPVLIAPSNMLFPSTRRRTQPARSHWSARSEEHTSELQSLMRTSSAVFCLNKNNTNTGTREAHIEEHEVDLRMPKELTTHPHL